MDRPLAAERTVVADDGARLAVQVHELDGDAAPARDDVTTLVLGHGWTLNHHAWDPVVARLRAAHDIRIVTWDQRGHGGSTLARGRQRGTGLSIARLGRDLGLVVAAAAPTGPLVLGGHSMGGMSVMAYAGQHPEVVADRVRGVGFVATAAGDLGHRMPRSHRILMAAMARGVAIRAGRMITEVGQRRLLFGDDADTGAVRLTRAQVAGTPLTTLGGFHAALRIHDETLSLGVLAEVPVRIIVGDRDRLTPPSYAQALKAALPLAALEVVPGAGHMLTYEATDRVVTLFDRLLAHA